MAERSFENEKKKTNEPTSGTSPLYDVWDDLRKQTAARISNPYTASAKDPIVFDSVPTAVNGAQTGSPFSPLSAGEKQASAQPVDKQKILPPEYVRLKEEYDKSHGSYVKEKNKYWDDLSALKKAQPRGFTDLQPPVYRGPDNPKLPPGFEINAPSGTPAKKGDPNPSINDLLASSKQLQRLASGDKTRPDFDLQQTDEASFKRRYAEEALRVGGTYGLKPDTVHQIVNKIYAFEDGGWGTHDTWSNLPEKLAAPGQKTARQDFHPAGVGASTAIGYNQLLMLSTLDNLTRPAPIANRLDEMAAAAAKTSPSHARELTEKAAMVKSLGPVVTSELLTMVDADKAKPDSDPTKKHYTENKGNFSDALMKDFSSSNEPTKVGISRRDLARGIHALNLDSDIGPIIQAQELGNILRFAQKNDFQTLLDNRAANDKLASEKYDSIPRAQQLTAVHDLLSLVSTSSNVPAEQSAFATTKAAVEKKLLALAPGTDPALSAEKLSKSESQLIQDNILTLRRTERDRELPPDVRKLLDKISFLYYGGITGEKLMPAAIELDNLAGNSAARLMLQNWNKSDLPTSNFFTESGAERNPVVYQRTQDELLMYIHRVMNGPKADAKLKPGIAEFDAAFARLAQ
ncbi:MAG: hypothetical protein P4L53_20905 [Candidatus Obscuribacterales bacterium]|nr:hypothetical protein [Candidatus Obscuribacterales bacterium]